MSCAALILSAWICGTPTVVDGDTLKFGRDNYVRLWGVDAEEMNERNGQHARQVLEWVISRRQVKCRVLSKDNYARSVGRCYVEETIDINKEVVIRGGALDCRRYSGGAFASVEPVGIRKKLRQKPYC